MIQKLLYERCLNELIGQKNKWRKECIGNIGFIKRFGLYREYPCHDGCVNALAFNSSGDKVISGSDDTCICITDIVTDRTILTHRTSHTSNIFQTKYVPTEEDEMISAARDGTVRHYKVSPGGSVKEKELTKHVGACRKVVAYNRNIAFSVGEDGCVIQSDLRANTSTTTITESESALYSIDSDYDNYFILCGVSHTTWLYDLRMPSSPALAYNPTLEDEASDDEGDELRMQENATCCKFNYNGSALITSYNNNNIYLYDTHDNSRYKRKYTGHHNTDTVKGVNFYGMRSEYVMSGSDCGHIFFWDTASEEIVQCLVGEEDGIVNVLEFNPFCPMVASSGLESCVKLWTPNLEDETDLSDLSEITEKNRSRDSFSTDFLNFVSRLGGDRYVAGEFQNECRQS